MKTNKGLTLTIVARATSNYGESLGNISSVQKVFRDGKIYATRSRESMKNAIMVQSGMYDDLQVEIDGATQKKVSPDLNAATCRALEGGYMNTGGTTKIRKSSFYLTDAISCDEFFNETRFHNNLYLATVYAKEQGISIQEKGNDKEKSGLMPYQYEYDKNLKQYSLTVLLDQVGVDENFKAEADATEKAQRVNAILNAVENLSLMVKGNLDNAEPIFVVGGIGDYKTHYFENVVRVKQNKLTLSEDLKLKINKGYKVGLLQGNNLANEEEINQELQPMGVTQLFDQLKEEVKNYYEGTED